MIDMHVHTRRCRHARGSVQDVLAVARLRGMRYLGFAEHLPLPASLLDQDPRAESYAMPESELADYVAEVLAVASDGHGTGPRVLLGVEADLHPGNEAHVRRLVSSAPFDFVLGSVHFLDGWAFDDPELLDGYDRWDADRLWARYFEDLATAAASGIADAIAHPDLPKKFGCSPRTDPRELYEAFAEAVADAGVAVEVSTAGLRKPCAEIYPAPGLLAALNRRSVPVTIGSDAHAPEEVGYAYDAAVAALTDAGYREAVVIVGREMKEVPL
ncbi:MAG: histidinol-phosphatase HisJ family protein [Anaerosomatales bacterium]|nr:histidinol-phosphatase HisJ family protein [Anaerosomatales bacterium]